MDAIQKFTIAVRESRFDADGPQKEFRRQRIDSGACGLTNAQIRTLYSDKPLDEVIRTRGRSIPIHLAAVPGGRRMPLLKVMLTTACERNCYYCPFRAGRNFRRVTFEPEELAGTIVKAYRSGWVEGVFLSTGILKGGANTQNKLLDTAEILRNRLGFNGYLHLKIMPGSEYGQLLRAMQLADRVSTNLEGPTPERLKRLAPQKDFERELVAPLKWADRVRHTRSTRQAWRGRWPATRTQFVVGAVGETDLELLSTVDKLYRQLGLRRAYFEAFSPVEGTPMEALLPGDEVRQQRLYEASFLLRDYGFLLEELPFASDGNLPHDVDPKQAYADRVLRRNPLELNQAERHQLLRVPGIGPRSAERLLALRRRTLLTDAEALRRRNLISERSAPYILLDGRRPAFQRRLFAFP